MRRRAWERERTSSGFGAYAATALTLSCRIGAEHASAGWHEPVADAADGLDRGGAVAEFPSERSHECLDHVAAAGVVIAPHVAQERRSLDGGPPSLVEVVEHLELEPRQVDPAAVEHELTLHEIEDRMTP